MVTLIFLKLGPCLSILKVLATAYTQAQPNEI